MMLEKDWSSTSKWEFIWHRTVDVVIPIPDSGNASALGFAEKIKKNLNLGL